MAHTIITHTDGAGYCTGIPAFDFSRQPEGTYDTLICHGDRDMCGFRVGRTERKSLSSEALGKLLGAHVAFAVFASGSAVTREWVVRSTVRIAQLGDPELRAAFNVALGLTPDGRREG